MLKLITEIQALAQSGLAYCQSVYDKERYERLLSISAELACEVSGIEHKKVIAMFSHDTGYATPKVDVRGAVFKDNKILLVQEKTDDCWSLPGGWADVNYSPAENIVKELKEETGYSCNVVKLISVYDKNKSNQPEQWPYVYKMFFICNILSGPHSKPSVSEIQDIGFFDLNNLPPLSLGRVNKNQIEYCFKHLRQENLPTYFE